MKKTGLVVTIIFALLAFACGFGGTAAALFVTQPAISGSSAVVNFQVHSGDTATDVANNLQKVGLIRNALAFRLLARYKHLDQGIEQGVYKLRAGMTMDQIISALQNGKPDFIIVTVPDMLRVEQYPAHITGLPNFNADNFMKIVQTGNFMDGTPVSSEFWFVPQKKGANVHNALEGYLYPDTYYMDTQADEKKVIETMLTELGEQLCPGPDGQPGAYVQDHTQCRAHAVTVGSNNQNIFDAMNAAYNTKDDVVGLYDTLIIASLTAREINNYSDATGVANVYHNRFLDWVAVTTGKTPPGDTVGFFGSDPSVEYARDTDKAPQDGHWWKDLADGGKNISPNNPYNTYTHKGLVPGPIAAPILSEITAAATPQPPSKFPYFYFVSDKCGKIIYGKDLNDFNTNVVPKMNTGNC
ncbi:MAG: Murein endolytic transglycosylase MltG [Ktedonobacterales bacterium]|jgi:UPF0755 protein|nr:MAG: Murein endolytic transglycosylase MltG [Ktedonobacterales bacterium]